MGGPWSGDYRKLSIVPVISGSADAGDTAAFTVNRTGDDGTPTPLHHEQCVGVFDTEVDAREAAEEAARTFIDRLLGVG